jgi:hypothetical protein
MGEQLGSTPPLCHDALPRHRPAAKEPNPWSETAETMDQKKSFIPEDIFLGICHSDEHLLTPISYHPLRETSTSLLYHTYILKYFQDI